MTVETCLHFLVAPPNFKNELVHATQPTLNEQSSYSYD